MFERWFPPRPATLAGRKLFQIAAAKARDPAFYVVGGVSDTPEGRFELYCMHLVLIMHRLKGQGAQAGETSQALFDAFLANMDEGLRDMGVGDLSVGKKMRKLGEAIYGRVKGYDLALASLPDRTALQGLIGRTIFGDEAAPPAPRLAGYVALATDRLGAEPLDHVIDADFQWPEFAHVG
jgi:cytochrome b pre-mRNA-processing protein 3